MKIVISCEHASAAVPAGYESLFERARKEILWSHRGWDAGALALARVLSEELDVPVLKGEWTRLLLDLNRSPGNEGRWSDFSRMLDPAQRAELETIIFVPYWEALFGEIDSAIRETNQVLHLSIHSFVRVLNDQERAVDVGILFDPDRKLEQRFSSLLIPALDAQCGGKIRIRENVPYAGTDDGLTKVLRTHFADENYLGMEIEVCSDLLEERNTVGAMGERLSTAIISALEKM